MNREIPSFVQSTWTPHPRQVWQTFPPVAKLAAATAVVFSVLAVAGRARVPDWGFWVAGNAIVLVLLALIFRPRREPLPTLLEEIRQATPLGASLWLYRETEFLSLAIVPEWKNDLALQWDRALFGELPNLFLHRHETLWLTEWMAASYMLYIPALVIVPMAFSLRGEPEERDRRLFQIVLAFTLCYVGFLLLPLQAPRFAIAGEFREPLSGWLFHAIVTAQVEHGVVRYGGCLPSAHVAAATVLLAGLWRLGRWPFVVGLFTIAPIYLSTVYLRLHYAVDVLGGWVVAAVVLQGTRPSLFARLRGTP